MNAVNIRNVAAVEQTLRAQDSKIAELEERVRVLTNLVMSLQDKMGTMHDIQARALQERYRGGTQ